VYFNVEGSSRMTWYLSSVRAKRNPAAATHRPGTPRHRRHWLSALVVPFLLAGAGTGLVPRIAQAAGGTDSTCTQASIQSDLTSGGTWTLDCATGTTTIPFTTPVTFSSGTAALQVATGKQVILDGRHSTQLFVLSGGTLSLSGLTLQNGSASRTGFPSSEGGAIFSQNASLSVSSSTFSSNSGHSAGGAIESLAGNLSVSSSTFSSNSAGAGGAIDISGSTTTLSSSSFSGNSSSLGGAIYNNNIHGTVSVSSSSFSSNVSNDGGAIRNDGTMSVSSSSFSSNSAPGGGEGGAITNDATLSVSSTTFSGNRALSDACCVSGEGGAIFNSAPGDSGSLSVSSSTFVGNGAGFGGAIEHVAGTLSVSNSTFTSNNADTAGGAIDNSGTLSVSSSTFSGNSAPTGSGGAILSRVALSVRNTIIANNTCASPNGITPTDLGYNLEYQGGAALTCGFTHHAVNNQNPSLGPLANNGGPTQTMALGAGSPAIDVIPVANCVDASGTALPTDQRGFARPDDNETVCDIGAYEAGATMSPLLFSDGFESGSFAAWSSVQTGSGGTAVVQSSIVKSGQFAARLSATSDASAYAYARKTLATPQTDLTVSGDFNVRAQGTSMSTVPLLRLFDGAGNLVVSLYRLNLTNGQLWVQHSGTYHRTTGMLPLKTWGRLTLHVITAGANHSTVQVLLNGTTIYSVAGASLGTAGVQTLQIGNEAHGQVFDLVADNIVGSRQAARRSFYRDH
jgi:predicted outer membrane repeat protein